MHHRGRRRRRRRVARVRLHHAALPGHRVSGLPLYAHKGNVPGVVIQSLPPSLQPGGVSSGAVVVVLVVCDFGSGGGGSGGVWCVVSGVCCVWWCVVCGVWC